MVFTLSSLSQYFASYSLTNSLGSILQMLNPCSRIHFLCASICSVQFSSPFSTTLEWDIGNAIGNRNKSTILFIWFDEINLTKYRVIFSFRGKHSMLCILASPLLVPVYLILQVISIQSYPFLSVFKKENEKEKTAHNYLANSHIDHIVWENFK